MKVTRVEDIMRSPIYSIEDTRKASEALDKMRGLRVKKILVVTRDGSPKGVLEEWRIMKDDLDRQISELELSDPAYVPAGTLLSDIQSDLRDKPAVYVHDPGDRRRLLGIVTAYDLAAQY